MDQCILLSHVFIRNGEKDKMDKVEFALKHWRKYNPDAHIVVTGHGIQPNIEKYCDHIIWPNQIIQKDINVGHPHLVSLGLEYIQQKGFEYVLKSRCDTVHNIENIFKFAHQQLQDKKMIVTQSTSLDQQVLGDLFLYSSVSLMKKIFDVKNWYPTKTGLTSLANNFLAQCDQTIWKDACLQNLKLIDICKLKWIDFRSNWETLKNHKDDILNASLESPHKYYWGVKENWHVWNERDECISKLPHVVTEKEWYNSARA